MPADPTVLADRFQIDSLIAEGGMAKVFKGTDRLLGRTVAVKVLSAHLSRDPDFVARFRREARSAASLSHVNVVAVYDTGSDGDFHYIVMEYIAGRTLAEVIDSQAPIDPNLAVNIATSACEALSVAHGAGIVHRDVKPGNIMIDAGGVVKVMDFGIAKTSSDGLTQVGTILGTVAYLAPEQASGATVDRRSDLYALGCVLYEMLTGVPPIAGESLVEVAHKLSTFTPPPPSDLNPKVPAALDRIVARAMAKEPSGRFGDALEMGQALRAVSSGVSVPASDRGPTVVLPASAGGAETTIQRPDDRTMVMSGHRESPRRLGLLVAGVLLVIAGAVAMFANLGSPTTPDDRLVLEEGPPIETTTTTLSPPPSPSPEPSPEPSPSPSQDPRGPLAQAAITGLLELLNGAARTGELSEKAARDVASDLEKAERQVEDEDFEDAIDDLEDAQKEVEDHLEDEEITPAQAALITAALNQIEQVLNG